MSKKILVVDDDPVVRNLICSMMTRRSYVCTQAADGEEALALLESARENTGREVPFDLVILDLMMPKANGWDVLETIERELPDFKRHIVVLSAAGEKLLDEFSGAGYGAVLGKPFDADDLYSVVERCIRGPHTGGGPTSGDNSKQLAM